MSGIHQPGEPCPGFIVEPGRCWQMVYDKQMQADHCAEAPSWTGRWYSPRGDRWYSPRGDRWWRVWACPRHLDGLPGLREFGVAR
jgi:hypothetical protein